ncbi:MAG: general secretion pathway protein GspB [Oleiphilaceae bacterium]|nr:general secretion pathway protein GspB [Oleiphilaceae bacterium]
MSYILDALRKSESDRQQGRVPDLGRQLQLIHQPRRRKWPALIWVSLGLTLNAMVLAVLFWPSLTAFISDPSSGATTKSVASSPLVKAEPEPPPEAETEEPTVTGTVAPELEPELAPETEPAAIPDPEAAVLTNNPAQPMVIVPSWQVSPDTRLQNTTAPDAPENAGRVLHLMELPRSFQRDIPTLIFNSHLYASNPAARRVMINDNYLRPGDRFSGILVEQITVDGVVLSFNGQRFRVGVVRNWISPN